VAATANAKAIESNADILLPEHLRLLPSEGIGRSLTRIARLKIALCRLEECQSIGCVINFVNQPMLPA
jgi:hypothetical protein